jgi:hypothetical protein
VPQSGAIPISIVVIIKRGKTRRDAARLSFIHRVLHMLRIVADFGGGIVIVPPPGINEENPYLQNPARAAPVRRRLHV